MLNTCHRYRTYIHTHFIVILLGGWLNHLSFAAPLLSKPLIIQFLTLYHYAGYPCSFKENFKVQSNLISDKCALAMRKVFNDEQGCHLQYLIANLNPEANSHLTYLNTKILERCLTYKFYAPEVLRLLFHHFGTLFLACTLPHLSHS